jgi:DNA-binding NarL/FixJ family response regulator
MQMATYPLKRAAKRSQKPRTLLLVDPDPLTREVMAELLQSAGAVAIVATARSEAHSGLKPIDLSILNIGSRRLDDAEVRAELDCLRTQFPGTPLAVFVDCVHPDEILSALHLGIRGYIPVYLGADEVLEGLRIVLDNGIFIPAAPSSPDPGPQEMAQSHHLTAAPEAKLQGPLSGPPLHLTLREAEVLRLLRDARTNREIARALNLAESTVKVHIRHILCELRAANRMQAVEIADRALAHRPSATEKRAKLAQLVSVGCMIVCCA